MANNEKAFPVMKQQHSAYDGEPLGLDVEEPGMDLRDYFAAKALQGLLANPVSEQIKFNSDEEAQQALVNAVYKVADLMMKARSK